MKKARWAATSAGPRVPVLAWHSCDGGFECATARVPLDYRHPRGATISIAVIRHQASDGARRAGTLFINSGGPAEQIEPFVASFPAIPAVLRARFDIITFDPRGFGFSSAVRCFPTIAAENNTVDPATPYQGAVAMARDLARARLLTVDGFGHTEFANPSTCATGDEIRYLTAGALPRRGAVCKQNGSPFPRPGLSATRTAVPRLITSG